MNKYIRILILVAIAVAILYFVPQKAKSPATSEQNSATGANSQTGQAGEKQEGPEVAITTPEIGEVVKSPLVVRGQARGSWFFEAQLPVTLKDQDGKVLARSPMRAEGDWMTTGLVPFSGTLEFAQPTTDFGLLIVEKDNPSGLPENDAGYAIPVRFK